MITPLEILLDPVSIAVLAMYAVLMIWEAAFPARKLPKVRFWKLRGLGAFAFFFFLSSYLPLFIDPYLEPYRLFDLTNLTAAIGGLVGVCLYEFGVYVWHRAMHTSDFLWRTFHQMHHSAERLDTYGAFYFSPMDMIGWTVLGSICFALLVGLSPQAITVTLLVTNFLGMFQHANIKTPTWLGYIIQRPESHTVHHAKGIHKHNYSDLPIFDILFGTFHNPKNYEHQTGFFHGASAKVLDMITFKDLNKERQKKEIMPKKVKELFSILLIMGLIVGCSKDDSTIIVEPDPVQETPVEEQEEPIEEEEENKEATLTEVFPLNGPNETVVSIKGVHLSGTTAVFFNDVQAEPISVAVQDSLVVAVVPLRAGSGNITLVVDGTEVQGPQFTYESSNTVSTIAGSSSGEQDGNGVSAQFTHPYGIAIGADGSLFVSDVETHRIRAIGPNGDVSTYSGGTEGLTEGPIATAQFNTPAGMVVDDLGNLLMADSRNHRIRSIALSTEEVNTYSGSTKGNSDGIFFASFDTPGAVAKDNEGNVYVADTFNHSIRKISPVGNVTTLAGSTEGNEDGTGPEAKFSAPLGIAVGSDSNIYVADTGNSRICKISPEGEVTTIAGGIGRDYADGSVAIAKFNEPQGIVVDADGAIYVADASNYAIRKIHEGMVSTVAGGSQGTQDGNGLEAQFGRLAHLAIDLNGPDLFVVDTGNHRIRKITLD